MGNSTQRSLWIALWVGTQFYRGFIVIPTDLY
ncbi:TetR family transcriptional regulator [Leptospira noguchii]|nr:TetR family transcriptional regulator [Leptospira noguchii]UOG53197.1 TetR family transcriptional regulator [Leptospira noguchii]